MKNFKTYIAESSLSRIMTHVIKTENFGVMSSFRGDNTKEQNLKSYKELITLVRKMGYGFIELKGGYQEESGFVNEKSLFIPNIKKKEMLELGKKYDQHSVIIKDKQAFAMIGTNESPDNHIGKVHNKFDASSISVETGRNKKDAKKLEKKIESGEELSDEEKELAKFALVFSALIKGSHKGKKIQFKKLKIQEKIETSMYYYQEHGPQWATVYEEIE